MTVRVVTTPGSSGGASGVSSVNGRAPDGAGNVHLDPADLTVGNFNQNVRFFGPNPLAMDGTYQTLALATQYVGDGSDTKLQDVYSTLAAAQVRYPFATALTQRIDYCAVMAGVNRVTNADGLRRAGERILEFPSGTYNMGSPIDSTITIPSGGTNSEVVFLGASEWQHQPSYASASQLFWANDLAPGAAPHVTYGIDATAIEHFAFVGMSMRGGQTDTHPVNNGILTYRLAGLRVKGSSAVINSSFERFSTGIGYGGGVSFGLPNTTGFDHSTIKGCWMNNVGYGIHFLPGSTSAGDMRFHDNRIDANLAAYAVADTASSGFVGTEVIGAGSYAPVGILVYDTGSHAGGSQVVGNTFINESFEQSYNCAIYCERRINPGGAVVGKNQFSYLFQPPHPTPKGWRTGAVTVTAAPGGPTGNTITVTVPAGYLARPTMDVLGNANVPAGTTVVSVSGGTADVGGGAWADATSSLTFTLSANLTGDPTGGTVDIGIPTLATIVAFEIRDNFSPTFSSGGNAFSVFYAGNGSTTGKIHDNYCAATKEVLTAANAFPLTTGVAYGNTWGIPRGGLYLGSGQLASGKTCAQGDLLEYASGGLKLQPATGNRPVVGAALQAQSTSGGNVDYVISANGDHPATVHNYTAGALAGGSLIKPDGTNNGGVVVTTNLYEAIGVLGVGGVAANSTGTCDWFEVF